MIYLWLLESMVNGVYKSGYNLGRYIYVYGVCKSAYSLGIFLWLMKSINQLIAWDDIPMVIGVCKSASNLDIAMANGVCKSAYNLGDISMVNGVCK